MRRFFSPRLRNLYTSSALGCKFNSNTHLYGGHDGEKLNKLGSGSMSSGGKPEKEFISSPQYPPLMLECELPCDKL